MFKKYELRDGRETVNWRDLPNNKYLKKIQPTMLYADVKEPQQLKSASGEGNKKWVEVIYDRAYVEAKIERDLIQPLACLGKEKVLEVISQLLDKVIENVPTEQQ